MADRTIKILLEAEAKGVASAKSQLSQLAAVEKAHAKALAQTGKERAQVEKAHSAALAMLEKEKAATRASIQQYSQYATAAGAALATIGAASVNSWQQAQAAIASGTGATGQALQGLMGDFEALSGSIAGISNTQAATAIADLNTHLGVAGTELQKVATAALQAGVDTNQFGTVVKQMGADSSEAITLLDQLTVASQNSGVSVDQMTGAIGKASARWLAAGGDMDGLTAAVVAAASEFGSGGLRGAMSEMLTEVDKGIIPAFGNLESQLGTTAGAVERTHEATITWAGQLEALKSGVLTSIGPAFGTMATGIGTVVSGLGSAGMAVMSMGGWSGIMTAVSGAARIMWVAITGPIGLVVTAIGALAGAWMLWGDQISTFLSGAWNSFVGTIEAALDWIAPFADKIGIELPENLSSWKIAQEEVTGSVGESAIAGAALSDTLSSSVVPSANDVVSAISSVKSEFEQAKEAGDAFLESIGPEFESKVKESMLALKSTEVQAAIVQAGGDGGVAFSDAFNAGFLGGPGGMMTTIPQSMMKVADDGSWMIAGGKGAEKFNKGMKKEVDKGTKGFLEKWVGKFDSAFGEISSALGAFASGGWAAGIESLVSTGLNILVPGLGNLASTAFGAFKKAWDFFKKPSETELAARDMFQAVSDQAKEWAKDNEGVNAEYQSAVRQGWSDTEAHVVAAFLAMGKQAGLTHEEAFNAYAQYEEAVREGNTELMESIESDLADWVAASEDAASDMAGAVESAAGEIESSMDDVAGEIEQSMSNAAGETESAFEAAVGSIESSLGGLGSVASSAVSSVNSAFSNLQTSYTVQVVTEYVEESSDSTAGEGAEARQRGGPVQMGRPYIVGERRPELFVPNTSGRIEPRVDAAPRMITIINQLDGREISRSVFEEGADVGDWLGVDR